MTGPGRHCPHCYATQGFTPDAQRCPYDGYRLIDTPPEAGPQARRATAGRARARHDLDRAADQLEAAARETERHRIARWLETSAPIGDGPTLRAIARMLRTGAWQHYPQRHTDDQIARWTREDLESAGLIAPLPEGPPEP